MNVLVGICAVLSVVTAAAAAGETLRVDGGVLAAVRPDSTGVRVFKGIPYAAIPTGELRWRAPAPVKAWSSVRSTESFGADCLQPRMFAEVSESAASMSEDCLYLNVWTPARAAGEKLPVLVWIHGGAYVVGSGRQTGASRLASNGLVVVSPNYRLGVFGFLSHPWLTAESPHHASGNYGLMDQIEALRWVQRNIAAFGGDPARVTVAGHSAGATSVNILMVSPLAKGLFHRAIALSGSAMPASGPNDGSPLPAEAEERKGVHFARALNSRTLQELRAQPADTLLQAGGANWSDWAWNASIDGGVLPESPARLFAESRQNDVPLLLGWSTHEGASLGRATFGDDSESLRDQVVERFGKHADAVFELYPVGSLEKERAAKVALAGEGFISYPTWTWAVAKKRTGAHPVFLYLFGYRPPFPEGWSRDSTLGDPGAYHGAAPLYLFGNFSRQPGWAFTDQDRELSALLRAYVANFARAGDPNAPGLPVWPAYGSSPTHPKLYIRQHKVEAAPDAEAGRFESLGRLLQRAPGSLRYRGMNAERWTSKPSLSTGGER